MRILHTADWHIGRRLGRMERSDSEAVLDELVDVTKDSSADIVVVAGDLFDKGLPAFASLGLVLDTLQRLAATGAHVLAIPGNHDSPELFRVLTPFLHQHNIHLVHKPLPADGGGIVPIPSRDGDTTARVAAFPFLHQAQVVDFMESDDPHQAYADRIREICRHYGDALTKGAQSKTVELLVGHFMIEGAMPSGTERELHIGEAYTATTHAIPSDVMYAALGHIHLPQEAPGSAVPARYSGSLMQLDFGEASQDKSVCLVELDPARPARTECIPITSGQKLMKVEGDLPELERLASSGEVEGAYLSVEVLTDGPQIDLMDRVRAILGERVMYVRPKWERIEGSGSLLKRPICRSCTATTSSARMEPSLLQPWSRRSRTSWRTPGFAGETQNPCPGRVSLAPRYDRDLV